MWETLATVRDLGRVQEIASVLVRYGFGDVVQRIGMAGALERAGRLLHIGGGEASALRLSPPERVRHALQDLGPTFVKLGQVLATRVDLLPPEWIEELGRLQSHVPAVPMEALRAQLEEDLGDAPERVFARFEDVPMAAASLAQAHRAWLHDGTPVVLKIRRPGIREIIEADLRLLARLAEIVQSQAPDLRRYRPVEVVRQFDASLRRELDFARECRNAERIAGNFAEDPRVLIHACTGNGPANGSMSRRWSTASRPGISPRSTPPASTVMRWRRPAPISSCRWCSRTACSTPIRIPATCSSCATDAWR